MLRCNTTQCGFDSRFSLYRSDQSLISLQSTLFSPQLRCPFQDKHKQKNLCFLKTDSNLSLPMLPAIRGNYYLVDIDRHGYSSPPFLVDDE